MCAQSLWEIWLCDEKEREEKGENETCLLDPEKERIKTTVQIIRSLSVNMY